MRFKFLLIFILFPLFIFADYLDYKKTKILAVQNKAFTLKHELVISPVYIPFDPYTVGVGIGFSYTYNFSDSIAMTFLDVSVVTGFETSLRSKLVKHHGADTETFEEIKYILAGGFRYTPFYYKGVFFNNLILHGHGYFLLGLSALRINEILSSGVSEEAFKFGNHLGIGFNIMTKNDIVLSLSFKDHIYYDKGALSQVIAIYLGFGVNFGKQTQ